jgi:hypothetical protein
MRFQPCSLKNGVVTTGKKGRRHSFFDPEGEYRAGLKLPLSPSADSKTSPNFHRRLRIKKAARPKNRARGLRNRIVLK